MRGSWSVLLAVALIPVSGLQVLAQSLPPDEQYVTVQNGHLSVNGESQRYWAAIGRLYLPSGVQPGDPPSEREPKVARAHRGTDALLDRFQDLGFNAFRLWVGFGDGANDYQVGDGSAADDVDYFIAMAKNRGMRLWLAGLNRAGEARPEDVDVIADPATADAWMQAVREMSRAEDGRMVGGLRLGRNVARAWDPRLEAIAIKRMCNVATHMNKHTGLRWCDDPVFGVWELSNEEWWLGRMIGGEWQKLPAFFRNQLIAKWNTFLRQKYGDDKQLAAAWGELLPGESLEYGTVMLAPMADATDASAAINDSGEQAAAALTRLRQQYQRKDFPAARGSDVLEFLVSVQLSHKQREAAAIKPLGKGTRLSPMILDTGIGYEIQSQYLHQHGDAVAHDAYVNGWGPPLEQELQNVGGDTEQQRLVAMLHAERLSANSGPWVNWLLKPPGIHQGVPWLEHNREEGKPFLCYETQIQQPGKYRADFPLRLAALASIQDWSWICWHYFQAPDGVGEEDRPFDRAMDVTTGSHPQGYHYTFDQVQAAMMRAAGLIFREREVAPVTTPTTFIYGRKSLYDPASMDYAGSYGMTGLDMVYTAYQYGLRIKIDPTREQDEVIGPVVSIQDRSTHNPYTPTGQITFDWKKGYLMMDAPAAVAWTGLLANYGDQVRFNSGVVLRNVTLENPQGIYDPVREDERYIAFALYSMDGKPLLECQRASLSLVSTSFNSGFSLAPNGDPEGGESGHLPVLKVAVGATVDCPALDGCRYTFRDWHMNPIGSGVVRNGQLDVPADADIFVVELER